MMENPALPENANPPGPSAPPIAQPAPVAETRPMPSSPSFGGYELVQPLLANDDGELWLARNKDSGVTSALALLAKDALADPGAIWRFRQELGRRVPAGGTRTDLLTINPPQSADDATNLRRIHSVRPGSAMPVMAPYQVAVRKERTEAEKKKDRKVIWIVLAIIATCIVAFCAFYAALIFYIVVPSVKMEEERAKAATAVQNAEKLTDAAEQWASDNSIAPGTVYTWHDISDHVPQYLREGAGGTGPQDPLGRAYRFPPTGQDVEIHPDTQKTLDKKEPDFFWKAKP